MCRFFPFRYECNDVVTDRFPCAPWVGAGCPRTCPNGERVYTELALDGLCKHCQMQVDHQPPNHHHHHHQRPGPLLPTPTPNLMRSVSLPIRLKVHQ